MKPPNKIYKCCGHFIIKEPFLLGSDVWMFTPHICWRCDRFDQKEITMLEYIRIKLERILR